MKVRSPRRLLAVALVACSAVAVGFAVAPRAEAASRWAPAASATIHPGVETITGENQCTANFVFFRGADEFIGQAAHCASLDSAEQTDGCDSTTMPVGTKVRIQGATKPGTLVYSSWDTMKASHEQDPYACAYNDLALIRIDPADHGRVNPSMPHWGGPTGIHAGPLDGSVYTIGNSSLRGGLWLLQPKSGGSLGTDESGWSHDTLTITPGIPGDSGSGLLDSQGRATGVLSTIQYLPLPGTNGWGDLLHELRYAQKHGQAGLLLALGTVPFNPAQLPLGL